MNLLVFSWLVIVLGMSEGREEMEAAIDVDGETLMDPTVVRSLVCLKGRLRTRATYRRVDNSSGIEAEMDSSWMWGRRSVTLELLEDSHSVYALGARTRLVVSGPSDRANNPGEGGRLFGWRY